MKLSIIILILLNSVLLEAQNDSLIFEKNFKLKNGIYTSYIEVLNNNPTYHNCILKVKSFSFFGGKRTYCYIDVFEETHDYIDSLFLIVQNEEVAINYKNLFYKLILKGSISTFYTTKNYFDYYSGEQKYKDKLYYIDLCTGEIKRLTPRNIETLIKRDSILYKEFSRVSNVKKKKTLYSYILKYNLRNPIYINTK